MRASEPPERPEKRRHPIRVVTIVLLLSLVAVELVARHGIVTASLMIASNASLVPDPVPGDAKPLTSREIASATGPMRWIGSRIVDNSETATAAQLLSRASKRFANVEAFKPAQLPACAKVHCQYNLAQLNHYTLLRMAIPSKAIPQIHVRR